MGQAAFADGFAQGLDAYRSGEYNNAAAQYNVAAMYQDGVGVKKDYGYAAMWYLRASKNNYVAAYYALADLHEKGLGVQKSANEAVRLWALSAQKGHAAGQLKLAKLLIEGGLIPQNIDDGFAWLQSAVSQGYKPALAYLESLKN